MDQIRIKDLEIYSNHGVYKEEKVLGQKFLVSVVLYTQTKRAGVSDKMEYSINYGEVSHQIRRIMEENTFDLIERVAEVIAQELLLTYAILEKIDVEVKKPWAPIGMPIESVSVKITRGWHRAYVGMGSNMGDRMEYIETAIEHMESEEDTRVVKVSNLLETKPYGGVEQDDFLNGCIALDTLKEPEELLDYLLDLEQQAGRERKVHWGPRTLDLDILLYDDLVLDQENLMIPHIEMTKRKFVLEPLAEIAPYKIHPLKNQTILELKEILDKEEQKS